MARIEVVTKVWIEEGCMGCEACTATAPEVFELHGDRCRIRPAALRPDFTIPRTVMIRDAAEECPVEAIRFETSPEDPDRQRRSLVSGAALTVGWVAFGGGLGLSIGPAIGRFMMPNVVDEPDPRVRIGQLRKYRQMRSGEVNEDYKPQGIWIIREGDRLAALSTTCTHLGCVPNWMPNDRKFKCPCHGSGFAPNGVNFEGPAPRPLERFRIYLEEDSIVVDKSKKFQYELGQWNQPGSYVEL